MKKNVKKILIYIGSFLLPWLLLIPPFPINTGNILGFISGATVFYLISCLTINKKFRKKIFLLPIIFLGYILVSNLLQYIPKEVYSLNYTLYFSMVTVAVLFSFVFHIYEKNDEKRKQKEEEDKVSSSNSCQEEKEEKCKNSPSNTRQPDEKKTKVSSSNSCQEEKEEKCKNSPSSTCQQNKKKIKITSLEPVSNGERKKAKPKNQ